MLRLQKMKCIPFIWNMGFQQEGENQDYLVTVDKQLYFFKGVEEFDLKLVLPVQRHCWYLW